jgi:ankyrin repeat protein
MDGEEKIIDGFKKIFFFFCRTALHWAAKRNHSQVVNYLLENGASKEIQAHDKSTPADVCSNDLLQELLQSTTSDSKSIFLGNY